MRVPVRMQSGEEATVLVPTFFAIDSPGRRTRYVTVDPYTGKFLEANSREALIVKIKRSGELRDYLVDWKPHNEKVKEDASV